VLKLLQAKAALGLQRSRVVDIGAVATLVGKPENIALGQQVADQAVTLVSDNRKLLPLKQAGTVKPGLPYQRVEEVHNRLVVIVLSDDVRTESGRVLERQIKNRVPDVNVFYVDPRIADVMSGEILKAVAESEAVVAAVYEIPTAGKATRGADGLINSVAPADASARLLQRVLEAAAEKTAVLAMGNPYLAQDFPAVQNYMCAFSNVSVSEISAVKALFGEIAIRGHLPVSIPNLAQRGAGIERPANVTQGESIK
jgi:beta-N-acetylhexosaminidase